ncbi:MAG: hypothetical protein ABJC09_03350 [Terriglobia bacterium]
MDEGSRDTGWVDAAAGIPPRRAALVSRMSLASLEKTCAEIAHRRGVSITRDFINRDDPATCDAKVVAAVEAGLQRAQNSV